MPIQVPIRNVDSIRHLSLRGAFLENPSDPTSIIGGFEGTAHTPDGEHQTAQVAMEVYTGWVVPGFSAGSSLTRQEVRTFLPIADDRVKIYPSEDNLLGFTATASPATLELAEDEANLFGVDGVRSVRLEPQVVGGLGGQPLMLVMRVQLSGLNVNFHRFTYQVTVLTREDPEVQEVGLSGNTSPD